MDYGKFKYEAAQKAKEARRNQANTILKEVRFRLKIDTHDYETKRKRAEGFLQAGDKVKAMILFRGREQSRPEQGVRLLQQLRRGRRRVRHRRVDPDDRRPQHGHGHRPAQEQVATPKAEAERPQRARTRQAARVGGPRRARHGSAPAPAE